MCRCMQQTLVSGNQADKNSESRTHDQAYRSTQSSPHCSGANKVNAYQEGQKAVSALQELAALVNTSIVEMGQDFTYWPVVVTEIARIKSGLLTAKAQKQQPQLQLAAQLEVNPKAPDNWSLQRLKGVLERGSKGRQKRRQENRSRLAEESQEKEDDRAEPFPQSQPSQRLPVLSQAAQTQTANQVRLAKQAEQKYSKSRGQSNQRQPLVVNNPQGAQRLVLQPPSPEHACQRNQSRALRESPCVKTSRGKATYGQENSPENENTMIRNLSTAEGRLGRLRKVPARFNE